MENIGTDAAAGMLLKQTISLDLHQTNQCKLSQVLTELLITESDRVQAIILQTILSVSARTYAPQLFTMYDNDRIHNLKFNLVVEAAMDPRTNEFEAFMDCINNSV